MILFLCLFVAAALTVTIGFVADSWAVAMFGPGGWALIYLAVAVGLGVAAGRIAARLR